MAGVSGVVATATPALWYLTRGTGAVTLVLVTASLVLGVLEVERLTAGSGPRFVVATLHRFVSLLVLALLAVHILTAVLDSFAPIRLLDAVVPFAGVYRPLWLGFGALAFDGLLAVIVTSLVRRRLGLRAWRTVHWLAYGCWPVAVLHGLGTGSDANAAWLQSLTVVSALLVISAIGVRLARGGRGPARAAGAIAVCALVAGAVLWAQRGPLAPGWARRSGTPAALLAVRVAPARAVRAAADPGVNGFDGPVRGTLAQGRSRGGAAVVDLRLRVGAVRIRVRMSGRSAAGGGLVMSRSAVTLGPRGDAGRYRGRVTVLGGSALRAVVGAPAARPLDVRLDLQLAGRHVTGVAHARIRTARGR
ncbi:MAG: hypothetical protein ABI950_10980 [Solirubrobacteraceae bacterium]